MFGELLGGSHGGAVPSRAIRSTGGQAPHLESEPWHYFLFLFVQLVFTEFAIPGLGLGAWISVLDC